MSTADKMNKSLEDIIKEKKANKKTQKRPGPRAAQAKGFRAQGKVQALRQK